MTNVSAQQKRALRILNILKQAYPDAGTGLVYSTPMQLLVAVMLSAQTTDKQVNLATPPLFQKCKTAQDFSQLDNEILERYIRSVNFYKTKARHIISTASYIHTECSGVIPRSLKDLVALPGVGRKTANVVLWEVYGIAEGVVVDTHVQRVSQALGLTTHTTPVEIERDLMAVYPQSEWGVIGHYFQAYGRTALPARGGATQPDVLQRYH